MLSSFRNPWLALAADPLWSVRLAAEAAAKCAGAELFGDAKDTAGACGEQRDARLDPFEFHGRRRTPRARRAGGIGPIAKSRTRAGRRTI